MLRRVALAACIALALAPPAGAWTRFATGVVNIVKPAPLRTQAGTELIVWNDTKGSLFVLRNGTPTTLLSGLPFVGKPSLVQQPNGLLQLYVPVSGNGLDGVARIASSAGFVNVYTGLNGESERNVFTPCCGYAESVAIAPGSAIPLVAFWSNATAYPDRYVVTDGSVYPTLGTQTASRDDRVPLLTVGQSMWLAWADGYPTSTMLTVQDIVGHSNSVVVDRGTFQGGDPHMALAAETDGKLWALWTKNGAVRAARSRTNGMPPTTFGATVSTKLPADVTAYQIEALARPGSLEALVNTGDSLIRQKLLPGLTVHATRKVATVLDDGFPVKGAKVGAATTDAKGHARIAKLRRHTRVRVTAAGYTPTSFRVP